MSYELGVRS